MFSLRHPGELLREDVLAEPEIPVTEKAGTGDETLRS